MSPSQPSLSAVPSVDNWVTTMATDTDFNLQLDVGPLDDLDQFSLLACQAYNFGNTTDWFGNFRGGLYGFVGIRLDHYASWAKPLSPRWGTVSVPTDKFRSLAQGVNDILLSSSLGKRGVA